MRCKVDIDCATTWARVETGYSLGLNQISTHAKISLCVVMKSFVRSNETSHFNYCAMWAFLCNVKSENMGAFINNENT